MLHDAEHSPVAREAAYGDSATNSVPVGQTLYTVDQLSEAEPALGKGAIRDELFHRDTNPLNSRRIDPPITAPLRRFCSAAQVQNPSAVDNRIHSPRSLRQRAIVKSGV
jgi:hypothetical protein